MAVWTGTVHGAVLRSHRMLSVGYSSRGSFWFTADEQGQGEGHAVVVFEPTLKADGINAALNVIKTAGAAALGVISIPIIGPFLSGQANILTSAIAVRGEYDQVMTTIQGAITGTLTGDTLEIAWAAGVEPPGLPFKVFLDNVDDAQEIAAGALATEPVWAARADVEVLGDVRHATSVQQATSSGGEGITVRISSVWSAVEHPPVPQAG